MWPEIDIHHPASDDCSGMQHPRYYLAVFDGWTLSNSLCVWPGCFIMISPNDTSHQFGEPLPSCFKLKLLVQCHRFLGLNIIWGL